MQLSHRLNLPPSTRKPSVAAYAREPASSAPTHWCVNLAAISSVLQVVDGSEHAPLSMIRSHSLSFRPWGRSVVTEVTHLLNRTAAKGMVHALPDPGAAQAYSVSRSSP